MPDLPDIQPATRAPWWRDRRIRALIYQALVLGSVVAFALWLFRNTMINLAGRGVTSGFGFLIDEAGFDVSEALPIPVLQGGLLYSLIAVVGGLALAVGVARFAAARGFGAGEDTRVALTVIGLAVVLPAVVIFTQWHSIAVRPYSGASSYADALIVGFMNTLKVSLLGCALATVIGFTVGIARLSSNWLIAKLAFAYVELIRNVPLLVHMMFWYFAVLRTLPGVRQSTGFGNYLVLNNRGLRLAEPVPTPAALPVLLAVAGAMLGVFLYGRYVKAQRDRYGRQLPLLYPSLGLLGAVVGLAWLVAGAPFRLSLPELRGFNYQGGLNISPEYTAMLLGLCAYHGGYLAEIVRSGLMSVTRGQWDAGLSVGLRPGQMMRLIVIPLALRVIVPPLTSQYLSLTKNSSLGIAVAYPELVAVGFITLNQSGQAIEIVGLTMAVYLALSLLISMFMNWYNAKVRLVEH